MNDSIFKISRFVSFFRWMAAVSTKKWIKILASITLATFLFTIIISPSKPLADNSIYEAIFLIGSGIIASMILSDINNPTIRQQFIAIPASWTEKYYTVLLLVILRTVGLLLALCFADLFKAVIQCLQGYEFSMAIVVFDDSIIDTNIYYYALEIFWLFNIICGLLIRKYPFPFGLGFGGLITIPSITIALKKLQNCINTDTDWEFKSLLLTEYPFIGGFITGLMIVIIFTLAGISAGIWFNRIQLSSQFHQGFVKQ